MSRAEVDDYISACEEPGRSTLEHVRRSILDVLPDAEQGLSYRVPAFRAEGAVVAGFAAFKRHLSYLPFSGSTLASLGPAIDGYGGTKSALHFPLDQPLPPELVRRLIEARLAEIRERGR